MQSEVDNSIASPVSVGIVVIGRNEGQRLVDCLASLANLPASIVYVDSGSTDDSVAHAENAGAELVHLDMSKPFTAGRARNEGFDRLLQVMPEVEFVQFIDGDCQVEGSWIEVAVAHLQENSEAAIVCGQRKERYPEATIYNRLCDIEWNTPIGEADACGGDFLVRARCFEQISGFNAGLIAGEEPEMCYRLRGEGWKIHRIDAIMTLHDAAMTSLSQWAKRSSRSGYAFAAQAWLHFGDLSGYLWKENIRNLFWALAFPAVAIGCWYFFHPAFALLLLAYPLRFLRVWRRSSQAHPQTPTCAYSAFLMLCSWTESYGLAKFVLRKLLGLEQTIIEYK